MLKIEPKSKKRKGGPTSQLNPCTHDFVPKNVSVNSSIVKQIVKSTTDSVTKDSELSNEKASRELKDIADLEEIFQQFERERDERIENHVKSLKETVKKESYVNKVLNPSLYVNTSVPTVPNVPRSVSTVSNNFNDDDNSNKIDLNDIAFINHFWISLFLYYFT